MWHNIRNSSYKILGNVQSIGREKSCKSWVCMTKYSPLDVCLLHVVYMR